MRRGFINPGDWLDGLEREGSIPAHGAINGMDTFPLHRDD